MEDESIVEEQARQQENIFLDRYVSSNAALWNCLFTAHGGAAALVALLIGLTAKYSSPLIWIPAIASVLLTIMGCSAIIKCFETEREHCRNLLRLGPVPPESDEEMHKQMAQMDHNTLARNSVMQSAERRAKIMLDLNGLSVLLLVVTIACVNK